MITNGVFGFGHEFLSRQTGVNRNLNNVIEKLMKYNINIEYKSTSSAWNKF